jgi:hypothetical protein
MYRIRVPIPQHLGEPCCAAAAPSFVGVPQLPRAIFTSRSKGPPSSRQTGRWRRFHDCCSLFLFVCLPIGGHDKLVAGRRCM